MILLATQPPQVEDAAPAALPRLAPDGAMVCFQNGLCEARVARVLDAAGAARGRVGRRRGRVGRDDARAGPLRAHGGGRLHARVARCSLTGRWSPRRAGAAARGGRPGHHHPNLLGARWSKLAINCAISSLGTLGGERLGSAR